MRRGRGSPGGCDNGISPTRPGCGSGISHTWLGDGVGKKNIKKLFVWVCVDERENRKNE
jgi:hypothetical protein